MSAVLRLAWLDTVRIARSWRTVALVVVLGPALWYLMELPEWFPDPDGPLVTSRAFIGDAVPYLWAIDDRLVMLFVLPIVLVVGSLVSDDRFAGGPMTSATRVGGPRRWWWSKVITIGLLGAGYVALFAVLLLAASLARGWELRTGPSPWAAVDGSQRILAPFPDRGTLGSTPILLVIGWLQLVSVLLIPAVVGLVTRNRVVPYAAPVGLILTVIFLRTNDVTNLWVNPVKQFSATQHDRLQVGPDGYVPWSASIAITGAWIAGLLAVGWFTARRTEL